MFYANRFVLANIKFAMFSSFAAASICPESKQESLCHRDSPGALLSVS